ncbi:protein of unknown function [Candidatus Filomicrobium marinum]|uniref:Uncharacterized protein n=1 Tax=Candidatus Filomicrobium marinum TaxID=1608628 RepID=A0A0D6JAL7_9HYPH|nr:hypothetical protein [Candidatus Filomicrobium marinum]CFW99551.1 protein of unknown function [Candidatus Filomicrobium marinum]CPR15070.1 protein of unknown function [Candidatus Filomicrobium marinum]
MARHVRFGTYNPALYRLITLLTIDGLLLPERVRPNVLYNALVTLFGNGVGEVEKA